MSADLIRWLRSDFADLNTELEHSPDDTARRTLRDEGAALVEGAGGGDPYVLLGAVGLYLAACHRHTMTVPERAQAVAGRLGLALGVAPRFVFAHLSTHNPHDLTFTRLPDEQTFHTYNGLAVLAYERAAAALRRIPTATPPLAAALYEEAETALAAVLAANRTLARTLDRDRFYHHIRPYFTPHEVNGVQYRGPNAGDFAAVSDIDQALGLCGPEDPFYQRILTEKYPYLPPEEQPRLRTPPPVLLDQVEEDPTHRDRFLAVCRAHAAAYTFHHHRLVVPFLAEPAAEAPEEGITASGPPLDVVLASLSRLVDLRAARDRPGTAHTRLARLRAGELTSAAPA